MLDILLSVNVVCGLANSTASAIMNWPAGTTVGSFSVALVLDCNQLKQLSHCSAAIG